MMIDKSGIRYALFSEKTAYVYIYMYRYIYIYLYRMVLVPPSSKLVYKPH
jgi:hypothetical protein